jgi:hypothetical protein
VAREVVIHKIEIWSNKRNKRKFTRKPVGGQAVHRVDARAWKARENDLVRINRIHEEPYSIVERITRALSRFFKICSAPNVVC